MRINRLELKNFRGFKDASVDFPEGNVAVFFGWNGAGKTAILDALAVILSEILFSKKANDSAFLDLTDDDILVGKAEVLIKSLVRFLKENYTVEAKKKIENYSEHHSELKIANQNKDALPIVAYYKTNRELQPNYGQALKVLEFVGSRTYAYATAINPIANTFFDLTEWFRYEEDIENQQKIEKRDFNWESQRLKTIRYGISIFLSKMNAEFSGLKVQRQASKELDFSKPSQKAEIYMQKTGQELKLSQLSSGERSLILLVADIARRAAILNPHLDDPLQSEGIVLIDEIELHLHPKWQRAVIPALRETFPNVQFIIATHSPQVLSEVENGAVFEIDNFEIHPRDTYGRDNNWLLHVIMEDEERPKEVQEKLEEYFALVRTSQLDAAARLRKELEQEIGTDEPEFAKADVLLRRKERSSTP